MVKFYLCSLLLSAAAGVRAQAPARFQAAPAATCAGQVLRQGLGLPGATVFVKGTYVGTTTNESGEFLLPVGGLTFPATLYISYVGCQPAEIELNHPGQAVSVELPVEARELSEAVVAASRVEETILRAPVTIEKITSQQIEKFATPEVFGGLAQARGVDVNSASMLFTSASTRGFNTAKSERVVQLYDYADGQLPSLSLSPGNVVGVPELDLESIEIVHGPASALYGANALNGVILFNSKDPFAYTGLAARVRGGGRSYFDGQLRYAQRLGRRWAVKVNGSWLSAREWVADDYRAQSYSVLPTGSPLGWDAVNRYGEALRRFNDVPANGDLRGLQFYTPGFTEAALLADDDHARQYRLGGTVAYLLRQDLKLSLDLRRAVGTSTYQNLSRFRLRDFGVNQYRLELKAPWGFVRAYSTEDFSGRSYELESLGSFLGAAATADNPGQSYNSAYGFNYFQGYYAYRRDNPGAPPLAPAALAAAQTAANAAWLQPGSARFNTLREQIIENDVLKTGSRIRFGSWLHDVSAQRTVELPAGLELTAGGAYRQYRIGSEGGKYFADFDGRRLVNYEYGAYAQLTRSLLADHLKLAAAGRWDNFRNFSPAFAPRLSAVLSLGERRQHNFRASFGRAYRSAAIPEQYYAVDLPRNYVAGNVGAGFQAYALSNVNPATGRSEVLTAGRFDAFGQLQRVDINPRAQAFEQTIDPLRLERVRTWEVGYRGVVLPKLYLDVNFFWSRYTDFIGATRFLGNLDGSRPTAAQLTDLANYASGYNLTGAATRVIYAWVNNPAPVQTRGGSVGLQLYLSRPFNVAANYSYNEMTLAPPPYGALSFTTFFNTPRHKYNLGANGALGRHLSYSVNYRWVESHFQEMPFASGTLADQTTFDGQFDYTFSRLGTTLQVGASNLFDQRNVQVWGGPQIGRLAFVGLLVEVK